MKPQEQPVTFDRVTRMVVWMVLAGNILLAGALGYQSYHFGGLCDAVADNNSAQALLLNQSKSTLDEMNVASGKYGAAAADFSKLNQLLEQTYGRSQR